MLLLLSSACLLLFNVALADGVRTPLLFVGILTGEDQTELRTAVRATWVKWIEADARVEHRFFAWNDRLGPEHRVACHITIEGQCAKYPEMSNRERFDDRVHGGPTMTNPALCARRARVWSSDCGPSAFVHSEHSFDRETDGEETVKLNREIRLHRDVELIYRPLTVGEAARPFGTAIPSAAAQEASLPAVLVHTGDSASAAETLTENSPQNCGKPNQALLATDVPNCTRELCSKPCQTGHLSLAILQYFVKHSDAKYLLRIDSDGLLCVRQLLADLSVAPQHVFLAKYYNRFRFDEGRAGIICRADENFMLMSRSVAEAGWLSYFPATEEYKGRYPFLVYRHESTFADNFELAVHLLSAVGANLTIVDDRQRIDSQQGWLLPGRTNLDGSGEPDIAPAAAAACTTMIWIHKIKSGKRLKEIVAFMNDTETPAPGSAAWSWSTRTNFWDQPGGDPRCEDQMATMAKNLPLRIAALSLADLVLK
jgi:hypothetical protein